ncbi:NUDIX domain-containing protein [Paenibacillus barcinonensis]|uniref:ADP-ribose pyrophosphatase YjhB (NUDIX family) n=1 Tax=Paenibacillus barcinonensis TaxID=198119 RepID=A0A2V4VPT0_PAEBA|nr:NUDIX domain-containing protein [Paenibacillus barcinonensis]PYE48203.1 ADP-ribose pyrophosphatase YjhB (NUDIX family) [Paenibacillus barcinonensis]QKS56945.1 NUDIX domain-containing protein [Paenibacillus barcinonensis]
MKQHGIMLVVSVSILHEGKVLIIKENKASVRNTWNFPSGRVEYGEELMEAARREAREETGYDVRLTAATGVYNFISSLQQQVVLFHFLGEIMGGSLKLDTAEIADAKWITPMELFNSESLELRDRVVMKQITSNMISNKEYPLTLFHNQI